jgi:HPt (histidine-containing phosphotransfer) domain-containing protein
MSVLQRAVDSGDASALRRAAHKLKGAAASLGAKTLAEQCYALELIGKENHMSAAQESLAAMEKEYLRVRHYMEACAEDDVVPPAA